MGFSLVAQKSIGTPGRSQWLAFFSCNRCQGGLVVEYLFSSGMGYHDIQSIPGDPSENGFTQRKMYPQPVPMKLPAHTPTPLDRYYQQASDSLRRGDFDASGAMSRKVVDVSTKLLLGDEAKKHGNIQSRINAVAEKGLIIPDLRDWAHQIRLGGNEAAHDEEPYAQEEAEDLLSFTELYLTYVYTLPGQLAARKDRRAGAAETPGTVTPS
jgi:hypothetical protein